MNVAAPAFTAFDVALKKEVLSEAFTFKDWQMENRKQYETDEAHELYQKFLWMALSTGYLVCKGELQNKLRRLHELEKRYAEEQNNG